MRTVKLIQKILVLKPFLEELVAHLDERWDMVKELRNSRIVIKRLNA